MARPRIFRHTSGGEIVFKNMPIEEVHKVTNLFTKADSEGSSSTEEEVEESPTPEARVEGIKAISDLKEVAVGTFYRPSDRMWCAVVVAFDGETGQAHVKQVIPEGPFKKDAVYRFKVLAGQYQVVE